VKYKVGQAGGNFKCTIPPPPKKKKWFLWADLLSPFTSNQYVLKTEKIHWKSFADDFIAIKKINEREAEAPHWKGGVSSK
jgi:hypothetical protein